MHSAFCILVRLQTTRLWRVNAVIRPVLHELGSSCQQWASWPTLSHGESVESRHAVDSLPPTWPITRITTASILMAYPSKLHCIVRKGCCKIRLDSFRHWIYRGRVYDEFLTLAGARARVKVYRYVRGCNDAATQTSHADIKTRADFFPPWSLLLALAPLIPWCESILSRLNPCGICFVALALWADLFSQSTGPFRPVNRFSLSHHV